MTKAAKKKPIKKQKSQESAPASAATETPAAPTLAPPPQFEADMGQKDERIRAVMSSFNEAGHMVIVPADEAPNPYMLRRPSGIMELDIDTGGGLPAGGCTVLSGPDNSGKTWLMLRYMAMQQKLYGNACRLAFGCAEGTFPFDQAINAGMKIAVPDEMIEQWQEWRRQRNIAPYTLEQIQVFKQQIGQLYIIRGSTGEEILQAILECVRTNAFSIIGCDSLNGLRPSADADKDLDDNEKRAAHASMIQRFFNHYIPTTTGLNGVNHTTLLFTQQVRSNQERANAPAHLQQYIKTWTISGGYAAKHYKLIDIVLEDGGLVKRGDEKSKVVIGKTVKWFLEKGKAGTHDNKSGEVTFYYPELTGHYGPDYIGELMTSGIKRGIIQQHGTKHVVCRPDTGQILQEFTAPSQKAMRKMIEADFDFELALRREVLAQANIQCLYR